jgi:hypothetical protein
MIAVELVVSYRLLALCAPNVRFAPDSLVEGGIDPSLLMPPELVAEVTYLTWAAASVLRMVY